MSIIGDWFSSLFGGGGDTSAQQQQQRTEDILQGIEDLQRGDVGEITRDTGPLFSPQIAPIPDRPRTLRDSGEIPTVRDLSSEQRGGQTAVDMQMERLREAQERADARREQQQMDIIGDESYSVEETADREEAQREQETIDAVSDPLSTTVEEGETLPTQEQQEDERQRQFDAISGARRLWGELSATVGEYRTQRELSQMNLDLQKEYGFTRYNERGREEEMAITEIEDINMNINNWLEGGLDTDEVVSKFQDLAKERGVSNDSIEDWINYQRAFAEMAQDVDSIDARLREVDVREFGERRVEEARRQSQPFMDMQEQFAAAAQQKVWDAVESGQIAHMSASDAMKRAQRYVDGVRQNLEFYRQQSYNANLKMTSKYFEGDDAESASDRENRFQAMLWEIANREQQVSMDYLEELLSGTGQRDADNVLENRYREQGYMGINDYITRSARELAEREGWSGLIPTWLPGQASGKDFASYLQNSYNINMETRDMFRQEQDMNLGQWFWRDVTSQHKRIMNVAQIGLGYGFQSTYNLFNAALRDNIGFGIDVVGALGEADLVRLANVNFTENNVGRWGRTRNTIGGAQKEAFSVAAQVLLFRKVGALSTMSPAKRFMVSAVDGRSAVAHNTLAAMGNLGRALAADFAIGQTINFNTTTKDMDIDVFADMFSGFIEVASASNAFFGLSRQLTGMGRTGILTFSKMIDAYGIDFGRQAIRRNEALRLVQQNPGLSFAQALEQVDNTPELARRVQDLSAYASRYEFDQMRRNVKDIETAIARMAHADPDGINQLLKEIYHGQVHKRINMVAETLKMNPDTPGKIQYLQQLQRYVADPKMNIADMIRLDQKVDLPVTVGPYFAGGASGGAQEVLQHLARTIDGDYIVNPFVELTLTNAIGRAFRAGDGFSLDEANKIAEIISNRSRGRRSFDRVMEESFTIKGDTYVLNSDGRQSLAITDNTDVVTRISRQVDGEESFIEAALQEAIQTGEVGEGLLRAIQRSGAYERVQKVFSKLLC